MPYFKDQANNLHFLDSGEFFDLLPPGCVPITDAEADELLTPTLDQAKAAKNAEINNCRLLANSSIFTHDSKVFSCDSLSRSDIDGVNGYVALYGSLPPTFPGAWKAVDNSWYQIADVASWKVFYASMVAAGAANFTHSQELKAQLSGATNLDAVAAIAW